MHVLSKALSHYSICSSFSICNKVHRHCA